MSAIAAGPDDSVWMSAMWGVQQLTPDGRLKSVPVPDKILGVDKINSLATFPDGTLLARFGVLGPTGVASRVGVAYGPNAGIVVVPVR